MSLSERATKALKVVGGISSVLGLLFALVQATKLLSERAERARLLREQVAVARQQLDAGDHAAAWASALAAAELRARDTSVRRLQEDVAMAWLRNAAVSGSGAPGTGPRSFSALVEPLVPVLDRGALETTGARRADILAHRGWADFLRGRDGAPQAADPARWYAQALAADSANPYAHAMWGHWILWNRGPRAEGRAHFAAALAAGRGRDWVRTLQLAAIRNDGSLESDVELLRLANAFRAEGARPDAELRRLLDRAYWRRMEDSAGRAALLAALPADLHLATYQWLFAEEIRDFDLRREPSRLLYLAELQANAGDELGVGETLRRLQSLRIPYTPGLPRRTSAPIPGGMTGTFPGAPPRPSPP